MTFIFVGLFLLGGVYSARAAQKNPDNLEVFVYTDKQLQRTRSSSALRKESTTPQHRPGLVTEFYGANLPTFANNGDSPTNQSTQTENFQAPHKTQSTQTETALGYQEDFPTTPSRRGTFNKPKTKQKVIKFKIQQQPKSCCAIQ